MTLLMIEGFKCDSCGHVWSSTIFNHQRPPIACAKCKSPYWNRGPNAMKGKEYKICIFCGKKRAFGPYPFMKPYAVCSSCIDNVQSFSSLMDEWQQGNTPLDQMIKVAKEEYRQSQQAYANDDLDRVSNI